MIETIIKGIRLEKILVRKIQEHADSVHLSWSEWVRQVLRHEVGLMKFKEHKR